MPDKLSRVVKTAREDVTTKREMTELVVWGGLVRATFTDFRVLEDGTRIPGDPITTSRVASDDPELDAWLDQGYARAEQWLAADAQKNVKEQEDVASQQVGEVKSP